MDSSSQAMRCISPPHQRFDSLRKWLWVGLVAGIAFGIIGWPSSPSHDPVGEDLEPLQIDPNALDLGEVWAQPDFRRTLPIRNRSNQTIRVTKLAASCGCTNVFPSTFSIEPAKTQHVALTIDLSRVVRAGQPTSEFALILTPVIDAHPGIHKPWTLRARVLSAARTVPDPVDVGDFVEGSPPPAHYRPISLFEASDELLAGDVPSWVRLHLSRHSNPTHWVAKISLEATSHVGTLSSIVPITVRSSIGESKGAIPLEIVGRCVPELYSEPPSIAFGILRPGDVAGASFTVGSRTNRALRIRNVLSSDPALVAVVNGDEQGTLPCVHLTYTAPRTPGTRYSTLSVHVTDNDSRERTVNVSATAQVVTPPDAPADRS